MKDEKRDSGGPMLSIRTLVTAISLAVGLAFLVGPVHANAQAALLMEQPYGIFGDLNPTGHTALYFERICAETPVRLRRCEAGELGVVISRYQGLGGMDWVAIPLIPYLYSVETASQVPAKVNRATVDNLRNRYHEKRLLGLGDLPRGNIYHGGWTELVGAAYQRRIYAFRFHTSEEQDDALIQRLNDNPNLSHFNLLYNNCADFARSILNLYFPGTFRRAVFPDAGVTTPKQIAHKLVRYGRNHPDSQGTVFEIPQIPGYRRQSRANKGVDESLATSVYAIPIVLTNPYLAVGLTVDYLARGRFKLLPKRPYILSPQTITVLAHPSLPVTGMAEPALTTVSLSGQSPEGEDFRVPAAVESVSTDAGSGSSKESGLRESKVSHE
jgi:hypothetical protein